MKTVFDKTTRDELVTRINSLNPDNKAQWGKMNVYQMLKHCVLAEEMYLGKKAYKRSFLGRLLGQMALKGMLKDEKPMGKNAPTAAAFKISETSGDIPAEKAKWIALIENYEHYTAPEFTHWFFGKMTREQLARFTYKHADHNLRQFNS
ncbi:MAG: DUF1569 domain-containing protein [Mucilaginibacter sp.]